MLGLMQGSDSQPARQHRHGTTAQHGFCGTSRTPTALQGAGSPPRATGVSSPLEQASLGVGRESSREDGMWSGGPGEAQWVAGTRLARYACSGSCIPWRPRSQAPG